MQQYAAAIIVIDNSTGDAIRFNSLTRLKDDCNIFNVKVKDPEAIFNHPRFKAKYKFFAYEADLVNASL